MLTQTYAVLLSTTLLELSRVGGFLSRFLLAVLAPIGAAFTHLLLSPKRELRADAIAAGLVDPHDLADALIRLDRAAELVEFHASPATEPLYTVSPFDHTERVARMFVTHPPVAERVARLRGSPGTRSSADRAVCGRDADAVPAQRRRAASRRPFVSEKTGGILLSRGLAPQVPSARAGLTSLFGMGRGISPSL